MILLAENIPEKGASLQKDMKTYAIIPYIAGGIIDPDELRKIADIADKYYVKTLKMTSSQRIAMIGIKPEDIDNIWDDLDMKPGGFTGARVRPSKLCPGSLYCKKGVQDTIEMGMKIDDIYCGLKTPKKLKIGVSGCVNSCAEPAIKDIGLIGTPKGWKLLVGGNAGIKPRIGSLMAKNLSDEDALNLIGRIIDYYKANSNEKRLSSFIAEINFDNFMNDILNNHNSS